jgi:hypothetical protein
VQENLRRLIPFEALLRIIEQLLQSGRLTLKQTLNQCGRIAVHSQFAPRARTATYPRLYW